MDYNSGIFVIGQSSNCCDTAHFRHGLLYAQIDNREGALDHFTTFLDAFTDPDPDYVWMVQEARIEVGRLTRGRGG